VTLTATTSVDLRLDNNRGGTSLLDILGTLESLILGGSDTTVLDTDVELVHKILGLVLMEVEEALGLGVNANVLLGTYESK
jgi:hypothetical protein